MATVGPTSARSPSKQRAATCWQLASGPTWSPAAVRTNPSAWRICLWSTPALKTTLGKKDFNKAVGEVPFKLSQQQGGCWCETSCGEKRKELAYCPSPLTSPSPVSLTCLICSVTQWTGWRQFCLPFYVLIFKMESIAEASCERWMLPGI